MARLTYSGNKAITDTGLKLTKSEVTKFRNLRNKVQAKRRYMTKKYGSMQPETALKGGHEVIFRPPEVTKNINDFETKREFNAYMRRLSKWGNRRYSAQMTGMYKTNFNKALIEAFGHRASYDLRMKITNMSASKFREMIVKNPTATSIDFIYYEEGNVKDSPKYREIENVINEYAKE